MDIEGAGPDAPIITNKQGGSQSAIPYRFDLIDGPALAEMAKVLSQGAEKYGVNNWRKIPDVSEHLNHMIMHAYAWMAGDRTDDHLSHIMCRAMFAQAMDITNNESKKIYSNSVEALKTYGLPEETWKDDNGAFHVSGCRGDHTLSQICQ